MFVIFRNEFQLMFCAYIFGYEVNVRPINKNKKNRTHDAVLLSLGDLREGARKSVHVHLFAVAMPAVPGVWPRGDGCQDSITRR